MKVTWKRTDTESEAEHDGWTMSVFFVGAPKRRWAFQLTHDDLEQIGGDGYLSQERAEQMAEFVVATSPKPDTDRLPLPTGPRLPKDAVAWVMSGMPKVGRTGVDLHVYDGLRAEVNALREDLKVFENDLKLAAGELRVPCPEPGSDASRMLIANRMLKNRLSTLQNAADLAVGVYFTSEYKGKDWGRHSEGVMGGLRQALDASKD